MSNSAEKKGRKKRVNYFATPYTVANAVKDGGMATKLSMLIMGFGNIVHKQIIKGLLFLALEICYLVFMVQTGFHCIAMLPSLGDDAGGEVWNEAKGIYEYTTGPDPRAGTGDTPAEAAIPRGPCSGRKAFLCLALNPPRVSHFPSPGQSRPSP